MNANGFSIHARWHVRRGVVGQDCEFCTDLQYQQRNAKVVADAEARAAAAASGVKKQHGLIGKPKSAAHRARIAASLSYSMLGNTNGAGGDCFGIHVRWHLRRGRVNADCKFCTDPHYKERNAAVDVSRPSAPDKRRRKSVGMLGDSG
jgi:hypothetical protein